jgi:tripartite-type tricarboxylate transporter receptor subunit TctC
MKLPRRRFLHLAAGAAAFPAVSRVASAQAYPARPVRIIVGFAAGGGTDIVARLIGRWLSDRLGQPFIIENRPGAASNIAIEAVAKAPSDGYTLAMLGASATVNVTLYEKLNYDFARDIVPVASLMSVPSVLVVHPSFTAKTVPELIGYAKSNSGKVNMASGGNGTSPHMGGELFKMLSGVNMVHVPYRGEAPALTDLIGGQVQVMFSTLPSAIEHIRSGKMRALAVTGADRSEVLPDVPAMADFIRGYEAIGWFGLGMPSRTPTEIIDRLNKEVNSALADTGIKSRFADLGGSVFPSSPASFGRFVLDEIEKWAKVVKFANIKPA